MTGKLTTYGQDKWLESRGAIRIHNRPGRRGYNIGVIVPETGSTLYRFLSNELDEFLKLMNLKQKGLVT